MRTVPFAPNYEAIEQRKNIVPYGKATKCHQNEPNPISFILYTTEQEIKSEKQQVTAYKPITHISTQVDYKLHGEVSVKITNIPLNVNQNDLFKLLMDKCELAGMDCLKSRPFLRLNLLLDRETRQSRGIAYINCTDIEKAREMSKLIRNITIEEYVLCAEIITN